MHDVSEGGVKRALMEVAEALDIGLDISSEKMPYERGVEKLNQDMLRVPTYGALIAIPTLKEWKRSWKSAGVLVILAPISAT